MIKDPDFNLINKFLEGDRQAFDQLVLNHERGLYNFIYRMISDEEEAKDISQRVFLQCFTHVHKFKFKCKFRTWLYQIAVNMVRNHYRQKSSRRMEELKQKDIIEHETAVDLIEEERRMARLNEAITKLPEKQHMTLVLRINEAESFAGIAEIMDCSVGTAKANYHHAVKKLKSLLKDERDEV